MGFALGTSTLVGQALGRNRPDQAVNAAKATMVIAGGYISVLVLLYLFVPQPLLELFRPRDVSPEGFAVIKGMGVLVLRFVAAYLLLDGLYMISTAVLKGAGDTRFIMWSIAVISMFGLVLPLYIGMAVFGQGLYFACEREGDVVSLLFYFVVIYFVRFCFFLCVFCNQFDLTGP